MSNFLITGGAGFIGSRLAKRLRAAGHPVTVLDNFHPQVHSNPAGVISELETSDIVVLQGDICESSTIPAALEASEADIVVHLAAETGTGQSYDLPVRYCETNVTGTARLVEAIRSVPNGVKRVILAGSRAVYGEGACIDDSGNPTVAVTRSVTHMRAGDFAPRDKAGRPLTPVPTNASCPPAPMSVYASTKLMQEYLLQQAFQDSGVDVGILRLQNVYGPGQSLKNPYTGVLSIFSSQLLEGKQLNIYEDGNITRDFVFVDDVVSAFIEICTVDPCPGEIVDIGTGREETILEVARVMLGFLGLGEDRLRVSGDFRPGDIRHAVADASKAQKILGWTPQVSLHAGIEALLTSIRKVEPAR